MKFLVTGDWHIDKDKIKTRKDNVLATCIDKLTQILKIADRKECRAILQPGDFFESHKTNDYLKQEIIRFLSVGHGDFTEIHTVFGQHDLRYHSSNVLNTPLKVLEASGVVNILTNRPFVYPQAKVNIYGASWFEDIPEIDEHLEGFNILVLHKLIVDSKIWEGQEDHTFGKTLLLKSKYDLIVSGDNHKHFIMHSGTGTIGKRFLINCGSLLRTRIDQEDHRPCVYIFDTDPPEAAPIFEQVYLEVQDFDKVIRVEEAARIKKENEALKWFVDALTTDANLSGIKYKRNVFDFVEKNKRKIKKPVRQFIDLVFKRLDTEKGT